MKIIKQETICLDEHVRIDDRNKMKDMGFSYSKENESWSKSKTYIKVGSDEECIKNYYLKYLVANSFA